MVVEEMKLGKCVLLFWRFWLGEGRIRGSDGEEVFWYIDCWILIFWRRFVFRDFFNSF